jgi:hypothetical protein
VYIYIYVYHETWNSDILNDYYWHENRHSEYPTPTNQKYDYISLLLYYHVMLLETLFSYTNLNPKAHSMTLTHNPWTHNPLIPTPLTHTPLIHNPFISFILTTLTHIPLTHPPLTHTPLTHTSLIHTPGWRTVSWWLDYLGKSQP